MSRLHSNYQYSVRGCCALLGYSKQAYYKQQRYLCAQACQQALVLGEVYAIRKELPLLGGRKLYHLLCDRLPGSVHPGRDAFFELLRREGLLIRKRKSPHPMTTLSWHHYHKYANLYQGRIPQASNRVWVADITYIRMANDDFNYLSLLTDAYSHKIVGWHLSTSLNLDGPLMALKQAVKELPPRSVPEFDPSF